VGLSIIGELWWWVTIVVLLREWGITLLRLWVIRYGVMDESIAEKRMLVAQVFEALDDTKQQSVRYLVLELDNGEFVHLVSQDGDGLTGLAAFKAFSADHAGRRSTPLARSPAKIVGNYRMLAGAAVPA